MGISEIFEILYSPVNALRKIIDNPDFKGILVILALVMLSMALVEYVAASKFFLETRMPPDERWTESTTFWTSNSILSLDNKDYKVGNYSIRSHTLNATSIILRTFDIEPVNVLEDTDYKELFFWIKWIHEDEEFPSFDVSLRLFFGNQSDYTEIDLTNSISSSSDKWNNVSISLDLERQNWPSLDSNWKNITGMEFRLAESTPNSTMKLDGIYFRKYASPIETGAFSGIIVPILLSAAVTFSMNWILWAGILLIIAKIFHEEVGPWTTFFVIIGHIFSVTVVYALISAMLLSTLPALNLPLRGDAMSGFGYHEMWFPFFAYQVWLYLPLVPEIWTAVLCAITLRLMRDLTWGKAVSISVVAFILRLILRLFFGF